MSTPRFIVMNEETTETPAGLITRQKIRAKGFANDAQVLAHPDCPRAMKIVATRVCKSVSVDYVEESIDVFEVNVDWADITFNPSGTGNANQAVLVNIQRSLTPVAVYRIDGVPDLLRMAFPADKNDPGQAISDDIGGVCVDYEGSPIDYVLHTHELTMRARIRTPLPERLWASLAGGRNAHAWRGYPKGKVLYVGTSSTDSGDGWADVDHTLAVDGWFHLRQRCRTAQAGTPLTFGVDEALVNGQKVGCAKCVTWYQPFKETVEMSRLGL